MRPHVCRMSAQLTDSAFNQLGQYLSSPGKWQLQRGSALRYLPSLSLQWLWSSLILLIVPSTESMARPSWPRRLVG